MGQVFFNAHCPTKGGTVSLTDGVGLEDAEVTAVPGPVELHAARAKVTKASNQRLMRLHLLRSAA
jgi:hypothetical protein